MNIHKLMLMIVTCIPVLYSAEQEKEIKISDNAIFSITYNNYGTRSEGQTGRLYIDKKEILGKDGDIISINSVKFRFYNEKQEALWLLRNGISTIKLKLNIAFKRIDLFPQLSNQSLKGRM